MTDLVAVPRLQREGLTYRILLRAIAGFAILLLLAPIVVVLLVSLTSGLALKFPPSGFSLRWYAALFDSAQSRPIQRAALHSFEIAVGATVVAAVLGTMAALAIGRSRSAWARALDILFVMPLVVPSLAYGLAALMYFTLLGFGGSLPLIVIGHVVIVVPFIIRTTSAGLSQLDANLLDSSASLGAGAFFTFRRVTLPIIAPGIAAGAFIGFMASFDNVPVSLFLSDARTEVLPMRMWGMLQTNLDVRTAAVSGLITITALTLLMVMDRLFGLDRQLR